MSERVQGQARERRERTPASVLHAIASEASSCLRVATSRRPTGRKRRLKRLRRFGLPMSRSRVSNWANPAHRAFARAGRESAE